MYISTQELLNKDLLTEGEILSIKARLTGYKSLTEAHRQESKNATWKEEYKLTSEQQAKGYRWVINKAFKPSLLAEVKERYSTEYGTLDLFEYTRKDCPFGYRELSVILNYSHFTFVGFYDNTNMYQDKLGYKNLASIWRMYDTEGAYFDYIVLAGNCEIIG